MRNNSESLDAGVFESEEFEPEDEVKQAEKELQKLTDDYIAKIDGHVVTKEKEIMTV